MTRIRFFENLTNSEFVSHYLQFLFYTGYFKIHCTNHVNQASIGKAFLEKSVVLPFPPLSEQHRIVQKIEELFADLDSGVKELEKAKVQIKNYRKMVLKNAVNGSLSRDWREENKNELEYISKNNSYKKDRLTEENSKLPFIPTEWTWTTLTQIGELSRGKSKHRPRDDPVLYGGSYPFIQTGNVREANGLLLEYTQTYSKKGLHQSRMWPKGTLCITIAANIADTAILGFDACFPDSVVGFISNTSICETKFIEYFFRTIKENLEKYAPATAQKNINLKILSNLCVPLPPLEEQKFIVSEIECRFSIIDQVEKNIYRSLIQAEKLRQSILKKAFEGKLVPQDPNDGSAYVLVKRINEKNAKLGTENKIKRKRTSNLRTKEMRETKDPTREIHYIGLYEILRSCKKPLTPKELWNLSKLDIEDFYYRLKIEVENGRIIENRPNDVDVYLETSE